MPTFFVIVLVIVVISFAIAITKSQKAKRRGPDYSKHLPPKGLELQPDLPLQTTESRLEEGLSPDFAWQLKSRIQSKYPEMPLAEFDWKLFELKRYFMMTAVLKSVPMYSDSVDDIWHEMLMFSREYETFGKRFMGAHIHHEPHSGEAPKPNPGERAWFDWVYGHLFVATPYSGAIWGSFFRYPLNESQIDDFRELDERTLVSRFFNEKNAERFPEIQETITLLIAKAKAQIARAEDKNAYEDSRPLLGTASAMPFLAGAMIFHSVQNSGDYGTHMQQYTADEQRKNDPGGSASSCGGWSESHSSNGSGGHSSDGGGSGSSSSCSTSSCSSSSCGGGGD
ncbi:hypothetical protein [Cohnella luojiensis]|uniref:Uncharacterized protein n=1 Tax=Cohnella luojiensis TaxID=652876 RepID=A0A4Y8LYL6_9BACL|nr:hypothetical protein [Cohnella luojiensis]TFE26317.1 hypothetical protein E2980_11935 [Cohnella luojiensis]